MDREEQIKTRVNEILDSAEPVGRAPGSKPPRRPPRYLYILASLVIVTILSLVGIFSQFNSASPHGQIISPKNGAEVSRNIKVTAYTENLPLDRKYVWLVVDVPEIGRCWPKKPMLESNTRFQTKIYEGGPGPEVLLSLYAIGESINRMILKWFEEGYHGGMLMIPEQYRLDTIRMIVPN